MYSNSELKQFVQIHGREYIPYCEFPRNVFWGECHGQGPDINSQMYFIETFKPKIVLHEFMGIQIYNPKTQKWSQRRQESNNRLPYQKDARQIIIDLFKGLADVHNFLLVGCDLTLGEKEYLIEQRGGRYQTDHDIRSKRMQMELPVNGLLGVNYLDLIDPERHIEMSSVYNQYRNGGLLMIVGLNHIRCENPPDWQKSDLHELIKPTDYGVIEHREDTKVLSRVFA